MQHKLAELKTSICVARAFVDSCLQLHRAKRLDRATAAMAKYWYACYGNENVVFAQAVMEFFQSETQP